MIVAPSAHTTGNTVAGPMPAASALAAMRPSWTNQTVHVAE